MSEPAVNRLADSRLTRARIIVVSVGFAIVGAAAGGIFDQDEWTLVVAPLPAAAVALTLLGRPALARAAGAGVAVLLAVVIAIAAAGGSIGDITRAFTSGPQGLLSTDWPSPERPELLGTVAAALATMCSISAEIAARRRFHLLGLLPLLLTYVAVIALSAPLGVTWTWLVGLTAVSVTFAVLRNDGTLSDRMVLLRGERRLLGLLGCATALVVLIALPVSLDARADPRRNDPAQQTAPLLDPIEATLALRELDPPADLHIATANDDDPLPLRWRTAALTSYDGRRWSPSLTLRPIGSTLGPAVEPTIRAQVSFLDDNLTLVPLPGPPVEVDAAIETDADRTVVRLAERPAAGDMVGVVANAPTTASDAVEVGVAPRLVDEDTSGLTQLAEGLAGDGDALERLGQLETTMREEFVLDSQVQGGGLEQALIDRFLRDTQRGTAEQFATSFVLLARSLGIEARVATGFVAGEDGATVTPPGQPLVLSSADASVWPEVQLNDGSWIAYDPVPSAEADDGAPPPPEPQVQTPAAPQPPIAPPPESDSQTTDDDEVVDAASDGALSAVLTWVIRGSVALTAIVLPVLVAAGLIVGVKYRRRRRRLRAHDPADRIRGAWASATDALVDAGLAIERSNTDSEIAAGGTPFAPDASTQLRRLATMSSSATFGTPRHPDLLAEESTSCLGSIEQAVMAVRTRWQRLRWRLSLRSLRPATRSPVTE
ncbi:MAG TPA: transglutaminaseTgpA domain-containing protein [Ilumatobacteraceae bacterium]|nr:transglutaminaseTgpA domain-containing protein [Ilumatobacteraceae bacterium]